MISRADLGYFAFLLFGSLQSVVFAGAADCTWMPTSPVAVPSRIEIEKAAGFSRNLCIGSAMCKGKEKPLWLYCLATSDGKCPTTDGEFTAKACAEANEPLFDLSAMKVALLKPVNNSGNENIKSIEGCTKAEAKRYPVHVSARPGTDIYAGADFCLMGSYCNVKYNDGSGKEEVFVPVACSPDKNDKCPDTVEDCFKGDAHTINYELVQKTGKRLGTHNVSSTGTASTTQTAGIVHTPSRR